MSITWGVLKTYIRESVVKDVAVTNISATQFSDNQMLYAARWACAALAQHTAQTFTWHLPTDGSKYKFDLADNIVDGVEKSALVVFNDGSAYEYLAPIRATPGMEWPSNPPGESNAPLRGYFEWPMGTLVLTFIPPASKELIVHGFCVWNPPEDDYSILEFPIQFEQPFAYIIGAMLFDPLGAQASAIRTWNQKNDSGNPEDNSLQQQSKYFWMMARERLREIGPQDRDTYYKLAPRDLGFKR